MNNFGKLFFGILAGVAVGATLALLLAPEKGEELREKLVDSLTSFGEDIKNSVNDQMEAFMDKKDQLQKDGKRLKEDVLS